MNPRLSRAVARLVMLFAASAFACPASASDTQWWIADTAPDYAKAEARGAAVTPEGVIELGPATRRIALDSLAIAWSAVRLPDGAVAIGGERGRIVRYESGAVRPWVRLPVGQVLSLAWMNGALYAGTGPEGLVYRIGAKGDTALVARTGERYVWGLAAGSNGALWAATGTRGRLLLIEGGKVRTILDSDESNLTCALADGRGGAWAGGDSKGRVFHAGADGALATVLDASEDEIRALALGADGALYAASLSGSAVSDDEGDANEQPAPAKSAVSGGRAVVYRIVPDSLVQTWWTAPQPFLFALAPTPLGLLAASGNRAGVYRLDRAQGATQLLAANEGQVTALVALGDGAALAVSSNPGAVWVLGPGRAAKGELTGPVLDARRIASFGRLDWRGSANGGSVSLFARSGNADPADTTWSAWRGGEAGTAGRPVEAPAARYLQWKVVLEGGAPSVDAVQASWRERNLPPRLEDLVIAPQGGAFREGELTPRLESVTQTLPGGQKVEYSIPPSQQTKALRALPAWARGLRTLQWKGNDPNGDELTYRVDVRRESDGRWIEIGKDLEATSFTWDTNALPDGRYRLRVTASDARSNALGEERRDSTFSEPFNVDNSPPSIGAFAVRPDRGGIAFEGEASDEASPLSRIEASLDDDDWRLVAPEGGLTDAAREAFRGRIDAAAGAHTLAVRVTDLAGNSTVRALPVTVTAAR